MESNPSSSSVIKQYPYDEINQINQLQKQITQLELFLKTKVNALEETAQHKLNQSDEGSQASSSMSKTEEENDETVVYNTEGYYMHCILITTSSQSSSLRAWMYSIGALLLTFLQTMLMLMIGSDSITTLYDFEDTSKSTNISHELTEKVCAKLDIRKMTVFCAVALIFASQLVGSIKAATIEEIVMRCAARQNGTSNLARVKIVQLCSRIRKYVFPWLVNITTIYLVYSDGTPSTNDIMLNFLAIGFLVRVDGCWGVLLCTDASQKRADKAIEKIMEKEVVRYSFVWVKILALLPSLAVTIFSVVVLYHGRCLHFVNYYIFFVVGTMAPSIVCAFSGIVSYLLDKKSKTMIERYDHTLNKVMITQNAISLNSLLFQYQIYETRRHPLIWTIFGVHVANIVVLWWSTTYRKRMNYEALSLGNKIFILFCSLYVLSYVTLSIFASYLLVTSIPSATLHQLSGLW